jgi:hypothetical protein
VYVRGVVAAGRYVGAVDGRYVDVYDGVGRAAGAA